MSISFILSLFLFLFNRVSSGPIATCAQQRPCFIPEFTPYDGTEEEFFDTMQICMVLDRSNPLCTKEDTISYACVPGEGGIKRGGLGADIDPDCDGANKICFQNAPCDVPAEERYVEFNFKDGKGCGDQTQPDCRFEVDDRSTCCGELGDDSEANCDPEDDSEAETPCCKSNDIRDLCPGPDPQYQTSCRSTFEGATEGNCVGQNYDGCVHRVYYECPEDCTTLDPTSNPTETPTTASPTTPSPTNDPEGQCTRQNSCIDVSVSVDDQGIAKLEFEYDADDDCDIDANEGLSHVCIPNNVGTEIWYDCNDDGEVDIDTDSEKLECTDTDGMDGDYEECACPDPWNNIVFDGDGDNWEFEKDNGDEIVIKIESFPDPTAFKLEANCYNDPINELHFHYAIKDQNECDADAVFVKPNGNLLCVNGQEANYCAENEGGPNPSNALQAQCLYSFWFCQLCPQYDMGNEEEFDRQFKDTCDSLKEDDPNPNHVHPHNNAMAVNEVNEENVFGLKEASKSETAGLLSFIVIAASVFSVVVTILVFRYFMKKRDGDAKMLDGVQQQDDDGAVSPITPVSPISMESNGSQEVTNNDVIIEA